MHDTEGQILDELLALVDQVSHMHTMAHRLERKVDYLIEVAGSAGDQAVIDAATAKLKASSDALEATQQKGDNST